MNTTAATDLSRLPPVSPYIQSAFLIAKAKYPGESTAWTNLSGVLAGRFSLPIAMINFQRQGDLDLLLRSMEDEFSAEASKQSQGPDLALNYQMMLSEVWILACYEILRAFRQRDNEGNRDKDAVSSLTTFKSVFADLELLRIPIAKFEIAKENKIKHPLAMTKSPPNGDSTDSYVYDKGDPSRSHFMQTGLSTRGSVMWLAIDPTVPRQYWVERRDVSDRLLALKDEVEPAGLREARLAAEQAAGTLS